MEFVHAVRTSLHAYARFDGTTRRSEFWWFALFIALGHAALSSLNIVTPDGTVYLGSSLSGLFGVATLLPLLAVTVRRLRDAGHRATELLWLLLPVAGLIVLIVRLCDPSRVAQALFSDAPIVAPAPA